MINEKKQIWEIEGKAWSNAWNEKTLLNCYKFHNSSSKLFYKTRGKRKLTLSEDHSRFKFFISFD